MPDRLCSEARSFFCTGDNLSPQKHRSPSMRSIQVDVSSPCCAAPTITLQSTTGKDPSMTRPFSTLSAAKKSKVVQVTFVRARARKPRLRPATAFKERKWPAALLVEFGPCLQHHSPRTLNFAQETLRRASTGASSDPRCAPPCCVLQASAILPALLLVLLPTSDLTSSWNLLLHVYGRGV